MSASVARSSFQPIRYDHRPSSHIPREVGVITAGRAARRSRPNAPCAREGEVRPEPRVARDLDVEAQLRPPIGAVAASAGLRGTAGARIATSCVRKTGVATALRVLRNWGHYGGSSSAGRVGGAARDGRRATRGGELRAGTGKTRPHFASFETGVVVVGRAQRAARRRGVRSVQSPRRCCRHTP
jgi:hypothetical protein